MTIMQRALPIIFALSLSSPVAAQELPLDVLVDESRSSSPERQQPVQPLSTDVPDMDSVAPKMVKPRLKTRDSHPRYELRSGDSLDLIFPFLPSFNQTVTVLPDGYITLRGIEEDLWVEGKTMPEVTEALQTHYARILKDPVVTVELKDYEKPYFIANGHFGSPGKYELRGTVTVTQAVAIAGGFTDKAKHSQVLLFRSASRDWVEVKNINVKEMLNQGDLSEDLYLRPGDMLYVPTNLISRVKPWIPKVSIGFRPYGF